jgi:hypothetical protein
VGGRGRDGSHLRRRRVQKTLNGDANANANGSRGEMRQGSQTTRPPNRVRTDRESYTLNPGQNAITAALTDALSFFMTYKILRRFDRSRELHQAIEVEPNRSSASG